MSSNAQFILKFLCCPSNVSYSCLFPQTKLQNLKKKKWICLLIYDNKPKYLKKKKKNCAYLW